MPDKKEIIANQLLTQLNTLAQEGKYRELADVIINVNIQSQTITREQKELFDEVETKSEVIIGFYNDLLKLTPDNKIDPEKRKIVQALCKEFSDTRMRGILETGAEYEKWKQKINNGEIGILNLIKDDKPDEVDDLAFNIALFKTKAGSKVYGGFKSHNMLMSAIKQSTPEWKEEADTRDIKRYGPEIKDPLKSEFVTSVFNDYPDVTVENKKKFFDMFCINPLPKASEFKMKQNFELDNGTIEFTSMPRELQEIADAKSPGELDAVKKSFEHKIAQHEKFKEVCTDFSLRVASHIGYIDDNGEKGLKKGQLYNEFMESLTNLTKIGENFKIRYNNKTVSIDDYMVTPTINEIKSTIQKGEAYYNSLKESPHKDSTVFNEYCDIIYDTIESLGERIPVLEEAGKGLTKGGVNRAIAEYNRQIERVNEYAAIKGYTPKQMQDARLNTDLGETNTALDKSIDDAIAANNVYTKHNDYDDAIKAMQQLSAISKAYKHLRDGKDLTEEHRKDAEKLREKALQAQEKINKYVERKEKEKKRKGRLDSKGTKRLSIMKAALGQASDIVFNMDDNLMSLDNENFKKEIEEIEKKTAAKMATNLGKLNEAAAMAADNNDKVAGAAAASGLSTIINAVNAGGEITPENQAPLRAAAVKYALYIGNGYHGFGDLTPEGYDNIIEETVSDPRFINKLPNITRDQLQTLALDGENKFLTSVFEAFNDVNAQLITERVEQQREAVLDDYIERRKQQELEEQAEIQEITEIGRKAVEKLDTIAKSTGEPNADNFDEEPVSEFVQAAQVAKRGMCVLIDTINEEGELDPGDVPMVREAYAALAIQAMGKASADKKIDFKDYITQVKTLAHDNDFIKTIGNIEKSDIMSFIKDEKAPAKLMDQVLSAKKFAKENDNNIVHPQAPAVNKELDADIKPVL